MPSSHGRDITLGRRMRRWFVGAIMVMLLLSFTPGCSSRDEAATLETFRKQWFDAVNNQDGRSLYHLLDAASKRWISRELDELRGLGPEAQRKVIDQLGGQRADNLLAMTPPDYFDLLWRQATAGRRPTMKVDAAGGQTAYITLSLDDSAPRQIRLTIEGGQWVWQLPESQFSIRAKDTSPQ